MSSCSVCDREFSDSVEFVGVIINVAPPEGSTKERVEEYKTQMFPYQLNKKYHVCYACWLKSMGIKP